MNESIEKKPGESTKIAASVKTAAKPADSSTIIKKKRNKKKPSKLTDVDILNNFMKSLHS